MGVMFWLQHHLNNLYEEDYMENYLILTPTTIKNFTNPFAKKLLKQKIQQYTPNKQISKNLN